nr:MAG TPA: hyaluronidase [Herelleviridae sp.]
MTKIQLRRDTATNWSTNNPTPSAGEPCFETDTGRLKIGDGITAYNSLPYQGGTSDTAVTTDTAQTISGEKTFTNNIIISQWNSNVSPIRETHIDLSHGNENAFISANGTDKAFGMYTKNSDGIQLCADGLDYTKGLSVKSSSLTFKNSDGTVTDLLAGGTGDVTAAGNNSFTGVNIFKGSSLNVGDDNNYSDIASLSGKDYTVGDKEDTTIVNPLELGASFNNTVLKHNVRVLEFDTASATKKAYSIMTKSTTNNEYMGHMAMPSDKYIDLELGASGTTYTAPADGYYRLTMKQSAAEQYAYLASYTTNNEPILSTTSKTATGTDSLSTWIAVHKGQTVKAVYNAPDKRVFRFIYAIGSEPST